MLPISGFCQTGPGGVGSSTNNVLWLKANEGVYSDGGTTLAASGEDVQQWNDQSGNSKDAVQSTAAYRPNYQIGVLNNFPVIRFTAANADRLLSTMVSSGHAASVWAVVQYSSLPSSKPGIIQAAPSGLAFDDNGYNKVIGLWVSNSSSRAGGQGVQSDGTVIDIPETSALSANTFYLLNTLYDGAGSIDQYVNSAAAGTASYNGTLDGWSDFGIGAQGTQSWHGDIAEVIVFNSLVNGTQKIIIDNYLSAKYNIPLSSNDYYAQDEAANGNYDFEVAGIGQAISSGAHTDAQGGMVRMLNPTGLTLTDTELYVWGHDNAPATASNTTDVPVAEGVEARFERVWRGTETGTVTGVDVHFDLTGLGPVMATDLVLLIDTNNDGAFADETKLGGGVVGAATLVSGNEYAFTAVAGLNDNIRFTLGTTNKAQTPLPIELVEFSAAPDGKKVKLTWSTASEKNNDYFTIERSYKGKDWAEVKKVPGAGNSSSPLHYLAWDYAPSRGSVYYRLKQTDFDGTSTFSNMKVVHFQYKSDVKVYPNPAKRQLHIELSNTASAEVALANSLGQRINLRSAVSSDKITFNTSGLAKGIYFLRILVGGKAETKKVIIH